MTRVRVTVTEDRLGESDTDILLIELRVFNQGIQFGETSEAINFAQKVVKKARTIK